MNWTTLPKLSPWLFRASLGARQGQAAGGVRGEVAQVPAFDKLAKSGIFEGAASWRRGWLCLILRLSWSWIRSMSRPSISSFTDAKLPELVCTIFCKHGHISHPADQSPSSYASQLSVALAHIPSPSYALPIDQHLRKQRGELRLPCPSRMVEKDISGDDIRSSRKVLVY